MQPIVGAQWLREHRSEVVLVDIRWYLDGRSGREAYEAAHAPRAIYIDLNEWLAGPPSPEAGRHPLPSPELFARAMAMHGISHDSIVIAYDDAGGVFAARLVWMLRATGHDSALLDGGLDVFAGELAAGAMPTMEEGLFEARAWPGALLANTDEAMGSQSVVLDARNRDRYEGSGDPIDPRSGHIPGALSVPCRENLDAGGYLKPLAMVRETFEKAGVHEGVPVISYCGSGITACHNLLTMEWAGLGRGRLFPGSWSQYSHDLRLPAATGPQPR